MAAAQSTGPSSVVRPLDQKEANRLINKYVVDEVITRTYEIIISWGCPKLPNETFFDFIKGRNKDEKLLKGNETKLNTTVSDEFDVDFLAKLLPVVCDNIEKSGNTEWNKRNKVVTSVEHLIKEAKDLRNEVTHERKGSAIATDVHQKALSILPNLVNSAGKLYNKKDCDVQSEISNVESWLRKAKQMTDRITRINNIKTKLTKPLEMKVNFVKFYGRETLAFGSTTVTLSDVFHCITLKVGQVGKTTKEMSCKDIFLPWLGTSGDKVNCLIIEGVAGSGKTTLLKRIGLDAVQATDNIFQSVDQFDFLIFIECRKSISSFRDWMQVCLPETLEPFEIEDAIEAARQLNPLILIDGLDELNSDSRKLLNESVELFKRNSKAMFVVTCRPYAGISFRIDLDKEGIIHQTASIKELSEVKEQKEFLARYQEQIPSIKSPELINAYVKLVENCFSHFQYPVYLVLFCHLFKISPAEVSKWTSEASVMEQTLQLSKEKMSERLRQRSIGNPTIIINEVIDAVCKLSLECLHGNLMSVTSTMYDKFCQECYRNISKSVDYDEVISSILVRKCSMYSIDDNEYTFFHNSHREFLAAKAVTKLLSNDKKLTVMDVLRNGSDEHDKEIIER
jgi:adenylate kinase